VLVVRRIDVYEVEVAKLASHFVGVALENLGVALIAAEDRRLKPNLSPDAE
jgi:hypothetical protein